MTWQRFTWKVNTNIHGLDIYHVYINEKYITWSTEINDLHIFFEKSVQSQCNNWITIYLYESLSHVA